MKRAWLGSVALILSALGARPALCGTAEGHSSDFAALRRFTVRDSVDVASFGVSPDTGRQDAARFSPDGRYFVIVTTRGLLDSNENESTLWLFDANAVRQWLRGRSALLQPPSPRRLVTRAASFATDLFAVASRDVITDVRWAADSRSVVFLARERRGGHSVFTLDIAHAGLRRLTPDNLDVIAFDYNGSAVAVSAATALSEDELYRAGGSGLPSKVVGAGPSVYQLMLPNWALMRFGAREQRLWIFNDGKETAILDAATAQPVALTLAFPMARILSLSPMGRFVVVAMSVGRIPTGWEAYETTAGGPKFVPGGVSTANNDHVVDLMTPPELVLVDLKTGTHAPLIDAPLGSGGGYVFDKTLVKWSPDERAVALSNTFVPLGGSPEVRRRPCVAVVEIGDRRIECIKQTAPSAYGAGSDGEELFVSDLVWDAGGQRLAIRYSPLVGNEGEYRSQEVFERRGSHWRLCDGCAGDRAPGASGDDVLSIQVRQSIDEPPVLAAKASAEAQFRELWNPNPQLRAFDLGEATVYRWRDAAGHPWSGGLVKPPGYVKNRRYPLVIQTHGFDAKRFLLDGFYSTANAARALANREMVVIQIAEIDATPSATPAEAEVNGRAGYESAIERLAADELIDPRRVGIVGFSRTGWYTLESLIGSPGAFAAAILADPSTESYGQYLTKVDEAGIWLKKMWSDSIGSEPFGVGLQQWLDRSPGFQSSKIRAPILFEMNSPYALIGCWDFYALLRAQSKAVDLLYLPDANHVLNRPAELLVSQETAVDWFDFWLNGHEDSDPAKAEQYRRWEKLCGQQRNSTPDSPTFCVPSSSAH